MNIDNIKIKCNASIRCSSVLYTAQDSLDGREYEFNRGLNRMRGQIDSGIFGISYLISMYGKTPKKSDIFIYEEPQVLVNGQPMSLSELTEYSCYLDISNSLFSHKKTVREQVTEGLGKSGLPYTADKICEMFGMEPFRFDRPIRGTGNERYKAMAAIGFSLGKQVFCFPWLSEKGFKATNNHMPYLVEILSDDGKIVILPAANELDDIAYTEDFLSVKDEFKRKWK
ncbi:MAG: hypothetical protein IJX38_02195 [Clostridia bacterium]|nr:hypothetical protein [Clostridia bacterium]MBQ8371739.1 hypothetical protein [Clostridia bacterium]